jgi:hypothetical protein
MDTTLQIFSINILVLCAVLISCGVENKFVLVQNVMVDQVSHEYYVIYVEEIFVA